MRKKEKRNMNIQKDGQKAGRLYICLVIGALAVGGICIFALPQQTYSAQENRYLTTRPQISVDGIFSGEVQTDLTNAANDQFPARDLWMKTATTSQYLLYHREINGVYIGENGYLFEKVVDSDLSEQNYRKNIGFVTALRQNADTEVSVMLVPTPGTILTDQLPKRAVLYDPLPYDTLGEELCEADSVRWLAIRDEIVRAAHDSVRPLYFKTDHHWTTNGAYVGASLYLQAHGITPVPQERYDVQTKSTSFFGTLYSKVAGLPGARPEKIDLPMNLPQGISIETSGAPADALSTNGTHEMPQLSGIYDLSKLEVKDQYAVYFGGNYGSLTITNPDAQTDRHLLILKDSYANSMVPYLIDGYAQITMIDLRYYNESVSELAAQDWDEILVCYEMSNFIKDKNLFKILR